MPAGVFQVSSGQHTAQVTVSFRIAGQKSEVMPIIQGYLHTLNRLNPGFSGLGVKFNRPAQVVVISQGQGGHVKLSSTLNQTLYRASPIQKRKSTMGMKVDKQVPSLQLDMQA